MHLTPPTNKTHQSCKKTANRSIYVFLFSFPWLYLHYGITLFIMGIAYLFALGLYHDLNDGVENKGK